MAYFVASVPVLAVSSAFLDVPYVALFAALPIVAHGIPALVLAWSALRRMPRPSTGRRSDRAAHVSGAAGTALIVVTGTAMLVGELTGWDFANAAGPPVVAAIAVVLLAAIVQLTRRCSGHRALSVDMAEAVMSTVAVVSPAAVAWGDTVLSSDESWFTVSAALAAIGFAFGSYWTLALLVRLGPHAGAVDRASLAFTLVGCATAVAHVAQGASGFTLPAPPLIALHATCSGILFLVPLHLTHTAGPGLDRLPPLAQVRPGYLSMMVVLAGLPALFLAATTADGHTTWAWQATSWAAATLVVIGAVRHLTTMKETRRLYAQVEAASTERQQILARLLERTDEDRHRVAAELLEQTVTAYMSVLSAAAPAGPSGGPHAEPEGPGRRCASEPARDGLAQRAEALRQLMQAIQPAASDPTGTRTLAVPIRAYLDNLYGDATAPALTVSADAGLFLDWPTETVTLRIVHEALDNVWRHSQAQRVWVTVGASQGTRTTVRIRDDGTGFQPPAVPGAGIATMRGLAALLDGTVDVDAAPGAGTTVTARLWAAHPDPRHDPGRDAARRRGPRPADSVGAQPPRLRLVTDQKPT